MSVPPAGWSPERDLPWSRAESQAQIRRSARVPTFDFLRGTPMWRALSPARREAFRLEALDWTVCQMIHGEALALRTAREIMASRAPARICAAAAEMVADEARHRRAFALYRRRVLGRRRLPYAHHFGALDRLIAREPRWDRKVLALQVFAEKAFVEFLDRQRALGPRPLFAALLRRVVADERRHCANGEAIFRRKDPQKARFLLDLGKTLIAEFPREVFRRSGLDAEECLRLYRARPRGAPGPAFAHLRGAMRGVGPMSGPLRAAYAALELL